VARELFLDRGARPRSPKSGTRNKGLRWNWRVFLSLKQAFSKKKVFTEHFLAREFRFSKKKVFAGFWSVFLSQTWLTTQISGGISAGGQLQLPPTSRAYGPIHPAAQVNVKGLAWTPCFLIYRKAVLASPNFRRFFFPISVFLHSDMNYTAKYSVGLARDLLSIGGRS